MLSIRVCLACYKNHGLSWFSEHGDDYIERFRCVVADKTSDGKTLLTTIDWDSGDDPPEHCKYKLEHLMVAQE
jgi:hypothetical protein